MRTLLPLRSSLTNRLTSLHLRKLGNLDGAHSHLYRHVLTSKTIYPEDESIPPLEWFPTEHGWRDYVMHCLEIYREIRNDTRRIVS
ncbi:MAG: hypothetical protein M9965_05890 [Anaerolineae bacterium]|nr:hypothetical protein [Anaerolineae bacterium]